MISLHSSQEQAPPAKDVSLPSSLFAGNNSRRRSVSRRERKQAEEIDD